MQFPPVKRIQYRVCDYDFTGKPDGPSRQSNETPSTSSNLQTPCDKPVRDVWSNWNGTISPRGFSRQPHFNNGERHPHWKTTHERGATNGESNLWECGAAFPSTSNCGPQLPSNFSKLPTKQRFRAVKQFLAGFVYNPNSEPSLQANKQRPLYRLMAMARRAGLLSVDRIPVGFKTKFADEVSQHIVVVVQHNDKYGALGISPNPDLMTKDIHLDSMSSIIENYVKAYEASAYTALKIQIDLPVEHDIMCSHFICWRHLCLSPGYKSWAESVVEIENHVLRMRRLWDLWVLSGKGHDPHKAGMAKKLVPSNFTPRGKTMGELGVASKVRKPVESRSRVQPPRAMATGRHWDAEPTGSNMEGCQQCEQLKRAVPPLDKKRASVTTVKRIKVSGHEDTRFTPKNKIPGQWFTHAPSDPEQQWEAESFESNTGDSALKTSLPCKAKQIMKRLVSSSAISTIPPRRLTNRRETADIIRKADTKLQVQCGRRKNVGPFSNFTSGGRKSKVG